jgi:hypothetical protein
MVIHNLWITDTVVVSLRAGDETAIPGLVTVVDDSGRWHHGLEVSVVVLASSFSAVSSEMALAEVNSFIAGCQPFCNIHRALHGSVLSSVTDVRAVMYSPWREAGLT